MRAQSFSPSALLLPLLLCLLAACRPKQEAGAPASSDLPKTWGSPWVTRTGPWPTDDCTAKVKELVSRMSLPEKVGQMTQPARDELEPWDIQRHGLGSVLSGGGSAPGNATPREWADMLDAMHAEALTTRLKIPLVYGSDAVHGHNNVAGATIFPHNIGLGATQSPELVRAVARATAVEMTATGVDWTFAPVVAAGRDERWGRTYETFSEEPELAGQLGAAAVRGYQGDRLGAEPTSVIACAKHFAGDGATGYGTAKGSLIDQGDTRLSASDFERLAIAPYLPAIEAGVGTIMVSFSSVNGLKMHAHRELLTDVLKGKLGFKGFLVTDWKAIQQLPGSYADQVASSANAGIDMFMETEGAFRRFIPTLTEVVQAGRVPMTRVDDAVTRVLTVKCEAGLFERGPVDRALETRIASPEHMALARRAVRESLVLLKNDGELLPLAKDRRVVVAGVGGDSLTRQAGGWTLEWQGAQERSFPGTTIFKAMKAAASRPELVVYDPEGTKAAGDVAVLVASETPYAEGRGDDAKLELRDDDVRALDALVARKLPVVVVLLSGRPLIIEPHLNKAATWVAAWLPGSAGEGIADVLYGAHAPTGKLTHSFPRSISDLPLNVGDARYNPLFAFGHGLGYAGAAVP